MDLLHTLATDAAAISRALVVALDGDAVVVEPESGPAERVRCLLLQTTAAPPARPAAGDVVLVWCHPGDRAHGVVLGRLAAAGDATDAPTAATTAATTAAPAAAPAERAAASPRANTPDELVIEAREQLTLRVGDGSITIRADGKILIKGKDLVSHAQRTNRIRGGSVAIN